MYSRNIAWHPAGVVHYIATLVRGRALNASKTDIGLTHTSNRGHMHVHCAVLHVTLKNFFARAAAVGYNTYSDRAALPDPVMERVQTTRYCTMKTSTSPHEFPIVDVSNCGCARCGLWMDEIHVESTHRLPGNQVLTDVAADERTKKVADSLITILVSLNPAKIW